MLYYSTKERQVLTEKIISLIQGAKKYLKTGNFFFRDETIQKELLNAAGRGVAVFVLSNLTGNENRGAMITDIRAETDPHITNLHSLEKEGVHVHLCRDLHAKFLIADGNNGLIMSANYTPDSLHGNPSLMNFTFIPILFFLVMGIDTDMQIKTHPFHRTHLSLLIIRDY